MPMAGKGMLLTSMDVPPEHEADFNRWYDREHLTERVGISGFIEARRYIAADAEPKYLSLYSTRTFDVLDSAAYRHALANQTAWSKANIGRFKNMIRAVARITSSRGQGRGAALGLIRLRPSIDDRDPLRASLDAAIDPITHDGIISVHLLESDPSLSRSLTDPSASEGSSDWFVLIDATSIEQLSPLLRDHIIPLIAERCPVISFGTYRLLFDIAATDL